MNLRSPLAALTLVAACGAEPRPTPEVMPEVAAEFGEIYETWDGERLLALFVPSVHANLPRMREHLTWLHDRLGECGAPQLMWVFGKRSARFSSPCERGALEVAITLDAAGKIRTLRSSATGIPTPEPLHSAAVALLASTPWSVLDKHRPFKQNLNHYTIVNKGRCELLRPWTVSKRGGLFHVQCEQGDAMLLSLSLHDDGTISEAELVPSWKLYRGPPVTKDGPPARASG